MYMAGLPGITRVRTGKHVRRATVRTCGTVRVRASGIKALFVCSADPYQIPHQVSEVISLWSIRLR